ncbi:MAG TPA: hypothetical protein VMW27_12105 [Thermoanaerobaculia bacterium]|nr:hypothetical protein [Thermoanaerobaculia bacterium]
MPDLRTFAHIIRDWQRVLQAFLDNAAALAPAVSKREALEALLNRALDLKARQDSHTAVRQEITQELGVVLEEGREQARQLRGMVKGLLGTKNERLVQFSVAPLRKRGGRAKSPELKKPKEVPAATE